MNPINPTSLKEDAIQLAVKKICDIERDIRNDLTWWDQMEQILGDLYDKGKSDNE